MMTLKKTKYLSMYLILIYGFIIYRRSKCRINNKCIERRDRELYESSFSFHNKYSISQILREEKELSYNFDSESSLDSLNENQKAFYKSSKVVSNTL